MTPGTKDSKTSARYRPATPSGVRRPTSTASGALVGAGDTRWPFVASIVGRYVFALPAALVGLLAPLGVAGLYLALVFESFVPGVINYGLFRTGRWKAVSRRYRPNAGPSD